MGRGGAKTVHSEIELAESKSRAIETKYFSNRRVCCFRMHVTGQKKTVKIQGSLEISVVSAQNIAHKMEVRVCFGPFGPTPLSVIFWAPMPKNLRRY